jgi:hypothetical protein
VHCEQLPVLHASRGPGLSSLPGAEVSGAAASLFLLQPLMK